MSLFALLEQAARRFPDRGAVYCGTQCVMRFSDLHDRALRLAAALRAAGGAGGRVVIASRNQPELLTAMFATWAAGMVLAPLNAKLHPREMADIVADAEPAIILAGADIHGELAALLGDRAGLIGIGSAQWDAMLACDPAVALGVDPDALAWLFYTSGTTGRSKGAMLSHRNLMAMTVAHLADFEDLGEDDSIIHAAPLSHGSGLYVLPYMARGARQVVPASSGFEPEEFLDLCDAHPGCGAFLAPTMVQRLRLAAEGRARLPTGLRSILYGGGPMYIDEIRRSLDCFGPVFRQLYGQGEAPMTITGLRARDFADRSDALLGSVGWARSGMEVRVVDEEDRLLPAGAIGEIVCRGDTVMRGYWRNDEATAATLCGGWLHTGDVGSMDAGGLLTLRDRSKDVIISGGTNIYPREVEEVLLAHPAVREAAVLGRPDAEWGESVVAIVAAEPGMTVAPDELDRLCLERIARFKRPKHYLFLPELPKSSYGKILKRELVACLADLPD
ncbi:MAG: AMP-binding protein [Sphingobium sp.]